MLHIRKTKKLFYYTGNSYYLSHYNKVKEIIFVSSLKTSLNRGDFLCENNTDHLMLINI